MSKRIGSRVEVKYENVPKEIAKRFEEIKARVISEFEKTVNDGARGCECFVDSTSTKYYARTRDCIAGKYCTKDFIAVIEGETSCFYSECDIMAGSCECPDDEDKFVAVVVADVSEASAVLATSSGWVFIDGSAKLKLADTNIFVDGYAELAAPRELIVKLLAGSHFVDVKIASGAIYLLDILGFDDISIKF